MPHKGARNGAMGGFNGGGLANFNAAKMKNVSLPNLLHCQICNKLKERNQFSNKQLETARFKIISGNANKPQGRRKEEGLGIRCRECVGQVKNEMQCILCGNIKDLNDFSKAQRKVTDTAKCLECMQGTLATEPQDYAAAIGHTSDDDEDYDYDGYGDDDDDGSETTFSNIWQRTSDGDYMTQSGDNNSTAGARSAVPGYDPVPTPTRNTITSRVTGIPAAPSGPANLTSANVNALNKSQSKPVAPSSRGNPDSAKTVSEISRGVMDMSVNDGFGNDDDDDDIGGPGGPHADSNAAINAWTTFTKADTGRQQKQQPAPRGQPFNAWGPNGQTSTHYRDASSTSGTSTNNRQPPRTIRTKPTDRSSKFAKVRPDNSKPSQGKGKGKDTSPWARGDDDDGNAAW